MTLGDQASVAGRFGFLQVRPLVVSHAFVAIEPGDLRAEGLVVASRNVMGNGVVEGLGDIVYARPEAFEARVSRLVGAEIGARNDALREAGRPYRARRGARWAQAGRLT